MIPKLALWIRSLPDGALVFGLLLLCVALVASLVAGC